MYKTVSIIGGDLRIVNLIELLSNDDFICYTYGLENSEEMIESPNVKKCNTLEDVIEKSEIIIGPVPMTNDNVNLTAPFADTKIEIEELITAMSGKEKLFIAGKISDAHTERLLATGTKSIDLFKREEYFVLNTIATAEGTIQIAMENTQKTVHGSRVLIMGFGRVGKVLAKMLDGIGAKVSCEARKHSDIAWIKAYGYNPIMLSELNTELGNFDIIINTIPFQILDETRLDYIKKECVIIDLSANPGGVDRKAAREKNLNVIWALSLAGKVAPITSAEFIKETLYNILKEI